MGRCFCHGDLHLSRFSNRTSAAVTALVRALPVACTITWATTVAMFEGELFIGNDGLQKQWTVLPQTWLPSLRENCLLEMMDFKSNDIVQIYYIYIQVYIYAQVYLIISYIWVWFRFMFSFSTKHQSDPYQLANCDVRSKSLHRLFFDFLGRWCSSACWKIMGDPERKPNIHWRCWVWPWYLIYLIPWIIWTSQHSERVSYHHQLQSYLHKTW